MVAAHRAHPTLPSPAAPAQPRERAHAAHSRLAARWTWITGREWYILFLRVHYFLQLTYSAGAIYAMLTFLICANPHTKFGVIPAYLYIPLSFLYDIYQNQTTQVCATPTV
jgi:hypothetical protein